MRAIRAARHLAHVGSPAARVPASLEAFAPAATDRQRILVAVLALANGIVPEEPITACVRARPVEHQPPRPAPPERAAKCLRMFGYLLALNTTRCARCGLTQLSASGSSPPPSPPPACGEHGHGRSSQLVVSSARPPLAGGDLANNDMWWPNRAGKHGRTDSRDVALRAQRLRRLGRSRACDLVLQPGAPGSRSPGEGGVRGKTRGAGVPAGSASQMSRALRVSQPASTSRSPRSLGAGRRRG